MWCILDKTYVESLHKTSNCYNSLSYYTACTLNLERILNLYQNQQETLTYGWDPKVAIYSNGLGYYWWRSMAIGILNKDTMMISHGIETVCSLGHHDISWDWDSMSPWVIQRTCNHEICGHSNSFSGIWHMLFWASVC